MGRNGVLGIVVPVGGGEAMHDVFHGKSVHATPAEAAETDLEKGDRIYFYDALKTHDLIGEAVITEVAFQDAGSVLESLGAKLFVGKDDFERAVASLPDGRTSTMRVLHFKEPTMYANPVRCGLAIPERGTYMTAEVFSRIAKGNA